MRRFLPVIVLVLITPLIAELLWGSTPIAYAARLLAILPMYGAGALLIRELVRRSKRGWTSILLLGAAYAIVEEGLALQSFFNPRSMRHLPGGTHPGDQRCLYRVGSRLSRGLEYSHPNPAHGTAVPRPTDRTLPGPRRSGHHRHLLYPRSRADRVLHPRLYRARLLGSPYPARPCRTDSDHAGSGGAKRASPKDTASRTPGQRAIALGSAARGRYRRVRLASIDNRAWARATGVHARSARVSPDARRTGRGRRGDLAGAPVGAVPRLE